MTSKMQPNKVISDVNDCIVELKACFSTTQSPIDDDNAVLHRLEEKLEQILLLGMKEKPGLLGSKKSYWDYIYTCFASTKRAHEGIQFVKSISELKTPLGRGRAFLRFCLMQKCLADTLQTCFMNQKTTREFYTDRSVPVQAKLWSLFITSLYDLNELNFDLTSRHAELDVTWPSFARKIFVSPESELSSNRNRSSSSLYSFSSQNEYDIPVVSDTVSLKEDGVSQMSDKQLVNSEMDKLTELNVELSQQCQCLKEEVQSLMKEKVELERNVQGLQKEYHSLQQKLSAEFVEDANEIDVLKCDLKETICPKVLLQDQQVEIKEQSVTLNESDDTNQDSSVHSITDSKPNSRSSLELQIKLLQDENNKLLQRIADFEHNVHSECDSENSSEIKSSACEKLTTECALKTQSNLPCSVDLKPEVNCFEQNLNNKDLHSEEKVELEGMESNISSICDSEMSATLQDVDLPLKKFTDLSINEFLLETKRLISDIVNTLQMCDKSVSASYQSRLNSIRDFFEIGFTDEEKLKASLIQNHLMEKYVTFIKQFAIKQDNIINSLHEKIDLSIKGNEDLYSKICILKDLLRSYGFFKLSDEHKCKTAPLSASDSMLSVNYINDDFLYDPLLKTGVEPVLDIFRSSFSRLNNLNLKIVKLQCDLNSSQELNNNLISRVRDQEMHLKGVTKELEEAQQLVSVMKEQHKKLQSTEGILKYDLQEKRKLLSKLKQQLETTRQDWNQVRLKNSKSEVEWQNLRKEFVQRHKQTSEESGFIDDKGVEEQSALVNVPCECNFGEGNSNERALLSNCNIEIKDIPDEPKKSRLELLEEQCQILYSSLLKGSKKREEIDNRLESICKASVKSNEVVHNKPFSNIHSNNSSCEDINDTFIDTPVEDTGENVITDENFSNSPQSSSDIGSLHSEGSSCIPVNCSVADSAVSSCPLQSPETGSPNLVPCELDCAMIKCTHENAHVTDLSSFPDSEVMAVYPTENDGSFRSSEDILYEEILSGTSPDSCTEPENVATLSQVDSLLIKKKDLEESLKHLNIEDSEFSSAENTSLKNVGLSKEVSFLEQEKRFLQNKVQELEKKTLIISTELDQTTQQLILSKAAKEHEVAALQFQLNTEALKYERALKQFSEQSTGLEIMKKKISDQEELINALEEALTEIREERESEREHQWQELQELQSVLEAREQECICLSLDLEKSISFIEEERSKNDQLLSQFEKLKIYCQRDKDALVAELISLQNDSKEMRKKLIKLLKEKDILWKRSDHLSYLHKAKINNRWVDDHEVSNCLGCKSNFSFILRKHHCRLCGRIFCYSCSNNWLLTASSSKRIRVCNECYVQYMEMKKDTRRGSDVPQIEDESEDEALVDDLSFHPRSSSSFNSDIPLSITDSIVSLPVKTIDSLKQSSPLFSSAPDLRCSFKLDEGTGRPKSLVQENLLEEADENTINCDANENESDNLELALDISDDSVLQTHKHMQSNKDSAFCPISTNEIEAAKCGVMGDLIINAGEKTSLPVLCQRCPMELQWSFSTSNGSIPVVLVHGGDIKNENEASVYCHSELKTEDSMNLIHPGLYSFQFDNTSRTTAMKIQYCLKAKPSDKQTSIANLCSSL